MTARALDVTTFVLPPASASNPTLQPIQANASIAFELDSYSAIQTLSSNLFNISPDQVQGLLYVPSLSLTDPCYNITQPFVPNNATRRANIPSTTYTAIAIAPWYNVQCTRSYLNAAMQDIDFLRGIIFFQTNDTSSSQPPPVSDPEWNLDDGGQWKSNLQVPAYAIPGTMGKMLMTELSIYSGNVSTAPNSQALAQDFGEGGMPRLYAAAAINSGPSLPSLWVFLIIVLGILLVIVTGSSLFMGFVQRRRRAALRRRVENGEVDLEALGIKRMTIPQSVLDKMPLYTFKGESPDAGDGLPALKEVDKTVAPASEASQIEPETSMPAPAPVPAQNGQYFSQTTCTICLDDFVSNETSVRELPCHHIFHPECVDPFLLEHSSACPVCKKSTLPDGFCPENITNAMVRREQLIRRIQDRRGSRATRRPGASNRNRGTQTSSPDLESQSTPPPTTLLGRIAGFRELLNGGIHHRHETQSPSATASSPETTQPQPSVEMTSLEPPPPTAGNTTNRASVMALQSESDPARRRELARQRAIANIDRQNAEREQAIESEERQLPFWRRAVGRVFPALTT